MIATAFVPVRFDGGLWDHAWVDAVDAERLLAYRWIRAGIHAISTGRLDRRVPAMRSIAMHRFILGLSPGDGVVHHRNEDGLDNRRRNLKKVADLFEHGSEPHPRKNRLCGHNPVPPHEREIVLRSVAA